MTFVDLINIIAPHFTAVQGIILTGLHNVSGRSVDKPSYWSGEKHRLHLTLKSLLSEKKIDCTSGNGFF